MLVKHLTQYLANSECLIMFTVTHCIFLMCWYCTNYLHMLTPLLIKALLG